MESEEFFRLSCVPELVPRFSPAIYGGARLATEADLSEFLKPPNEAQPFYFPDVSLLLEDGSGTRYEPLYKRRLYLPADIRARNLMIVGQTGSGKTTGLMEPAMILDIMHQTSLVAVDLKGDLLQRLEPFVQQFRPGTEVVVVNPMDPARTVGWNPFARKTADIETAIEDATNFCMASETRPNTQDSIFWTLGAGRFLASLILCTMKREGDACLADAHHATELPRKELLELLAHHHEVPYAAGIHSFVASDSHNAHTVLATLQGYLQALASPRLAAATSADEFSFETLFVKPTVVIFEINQSDVDRLRPYVNLFFSQLFRSITKYAERQPQGRLAIPLSLYLDDFAAAIGRIPGFGSYVNVLRSRNVRMMAAVQSFGQLPHYYGTEAESVISGFASKIFKTPIEWSDAKWASENAGNTTVAEFQNETTVCAACQNAPPRALRVVGRPLLLPEEVRLAPEHFLYGRAATVFLPDVPPFQCWFRPSFQIPEFAQTLREAARRPRSVQLRATPLSWEPPLVEAKAPQAAPPNMTVEQIRAALEAAKEHLGLARESVEARMWWDAFERVNQDRLPQVLRMAEELANRKATVTDYLVALRSSGTDNIMANLHYVDYVRIKMVHEQRNRKQASRSA